MARPCEVRDPCRQGAARPSRRPEFPAAAVRNEPFGRAGKTIHGGDILSLPLEEPEFPPVEASVVPDQADAPGRRIADSDPDGNPPPGGPVRE